MIPSTPAKNAVRIPRTRSPQRSEGGNANYKKKGEERSVKKGGIAHLYYANNPPAERVARRRLRKERYVYTRKREEKRKGGSCVCDNVPHKKGRLRQGTGRMDCNYAKLRLNKMK